MVTENKVAAVMMLGRLWYAFPVLNNITCGVLVTNLQGLV